MYKRIVVKVGTSSLTHQSGDLDLRHIDLLTRAVSDLAANHEVVLVSSGAIAAGMGVMGLKQRPLSVSGKQALAGVGQIRLMHIYDKFFSEYGRRTAQILLTTTDVSESARGELSSTFEELIGWRVLPIVNENDSVSSAEIEQGSAKTFGDNDTLSALVAAYINADLLILLTDIDGLYDSDPRVNPCAKLIRRATRVTDSMRAAAGGSGSNRGTGGMATKLNAAEIALAHGVNMVIANACEPSVILKIAEGEEAGTMFSADE